MIFQKIQLLTKKSKQTIIIWKGVENLKIEVNKKLITSVCIVIVLLSALIYNILYINNEKNAIIEEIENEELEELTEECK